MVSTSTPRKRISIATRPFAGYFQPIPKRQQMSRDKKSRVAIEIRIRGVEVLTILKVDRYKLARSE